MLRVQILRGNLSSGIESSVLRRRTRRARFSLARQLLCSVVLGLTACVGFHPARASTASHRARLSDHPANFSTRSTGGSQETTSSYGRLSLRRREARHASEAPSGSGSTPSHCR